jgi:hypothetical protein
MKSALECFQHAAECEEMARDAVDDANRSLLLSTAAHWHKLGEAAKAREQKVTGPTPTRDQGRRGGG